MDLPSLNSSLSFSGCSNGGTEDALNAWWTVFFSATISAPKDVWVYLKERLSSVQEIRSGTLTNRKRDAASVQPRAQEEDTFLHLQQCWHVPPFYGWGNSDLEVLLPANGTTAAVCVHYLGR